LLKARSHTKDEKKSLNFAIRRYTRAIKTFEISRLSAGGEKYQKKNANRHSRI